MGLPIMSLRHLPVRSIMGPVIALGLVAAAPLGARPGDPSPSEKAVPAADTLPPIVFFVAKGDPDACGPGCREWIAADGRIDPGADDRLRALLRKLGGRKLPIFFHSPGGRVEVALAIGRMLRARGLTAGVARTVPVGCDAKQTREAACDKLKREGRELLADLDMARTMCNSACVFALVGGAVRDLGAGVRLGVHSVRLAATSGPGGAGHARVTAAAEQRALQQIYQRIAAYLAEMGIAPRLLAAAREIDTHSLRYLTRDEVVAFGIDRREAVESSWQFIESAASASATKILEARDDESSGFRTTTLTLRCATPLEVTLQYRHEAGAVARSLPRLRLTAGAGSFPLGRAITLATTRGTRRQVEMLDARLPISILREPAFAIEAVESAAAVPDPSAIEARFATVTVRSLGSGLSQLARSCAAPPAVPHGSPAVEHI